MPEPYTAMKFSLVYSLNHYPQVITIIRLYLNRKVYGVCKNKTWSVFRFLLAMQPEGSLVGHKPLLSRGWDPGNVEADNRRTLLITLAQHPVTTRKLVLGWPKRWQEEIATRWREFVINLRGFRPTRILKNMAIMVLALGFNMLACRPGPGYMGSHVGLIATPRPTYVK